MGFRKRCFLAAALVIAFSCQLLGSWNVYGAAEENTTSQAAYLSSQAELNLWLEKWRKKWLGLENVSQELQEDQAARNTRAEKIREAEKEAVSEVSRGGDIAAQEEILLLARIIYAEARGESFEGQVAVGAVVVNRVKNASFPSNIRDVIYQQGQFCSVNNQQINLSPNDSAYQAAQTALGGSDPTNGALFFYNPRTATDSWIKSRQVVSEIGNHAFCI